MNVAESSPLQAADERDQRAGREGQFLSTRSWGLTSTARPGPRRVSGFLAVADIRLVVGELRADVTRSRKAGSRRRLKIDYGTLRSPRQRSDGCGGTSKASPALASCTAGRSPSSRPSSTRNCWPCSEPADLPDALGFTQGSRSQSP